MKTKYIIVYEKMGGQYYYMIYKREYIFFMLFTHYVFYERWNTPFSASIRLDELITGQTGSIL